MSAASQKDSNTTHNQLNAPTPAERVWGKPSLEHMRGFLPLRPPQRPGQEFAALEQLLEQMPVITKTPSGSNSGLLASKRFQQKALKLPDFTKAIENILAELNSAQTTNTRKDACADTLAYLFRDFQYLKMGYLFEPVHHGEEKAATLLPAQIARPLMLLAHTFERHPWLEYASGYVIMNSDFNHPITPHNIALIRQWHGGPDEYYFQSVHSVIEYETPKLFCTLSALIKGVESNTEAQVQNAMACGIDLSKNIVNTLKLMPKLSRPAYYSADVRPQIQGLTGNTGEGKLFDARGVFFEGCGEQNFEGSQGLWVNDIRGQTGAQSSIIPLLDNFLGITQFYDSEDNPLTAMLRAFRHYRPQPHVELLEHIEKRQTELSIRDYLKSTTPLQLAHWTYQVCQFREFHYYLAMAYIVKPGLKHQPTSQSRNIGTGGSPTPSYLPQHVKETLLALVDALDHVKTQALSKGELTLYQELRQACDRTQQDNEKRAETVGRYLDGQCPESQLDMTLTQSAQALEVTTA